ncbi:hypothetical protein BGZ65_007773 [Modicella reniformis]|uniref:Uncharacterized protein n=1 Tax=Modicella reniformis TaxID=1440133 RepID=A0A9P6J822_9FUNG|nr:hypothetical protein BGZ65_007773 [Modicella reniformis]
MGVAGLAKIVKVTEGTLTNLKLKTVHIDFLSMYFSFIQSHCFRVTSITIAKETRSSTASTATTLSATASTAMTLSALSATTLSASTSSTSTISVPTEGSSSRKRRATSVDSLSLPTKRMKVPSDVLTDIRQNTDHPALFIGSDGHITPHSPEQNPRSFRYAARTLDQMMERSFDKATTTIHCDGMPSVQKSQERSRRKEYLNKHLKELTSRVEGLSIKKGAPTSLYKKCRTLYRAPAAALDEILEELLRLGWRVCRCPFQADTHIGDLCRKDPDNENIAVITKDTDLLVYEGVHSVTMPIGRAHELTTFNKADVLSSLSLPSARHLLLTAILSTNDYSNSIPWYGVHRNAEIVRDLDLEYVPSSSDAHRVGVITDAISEYLARIEKPHKRTPAHYDNAISAFVECRENWSSSATSSTSTHDQISALIRKLEERKLARRVSLSSEIESRQSSSILQQQEPPQANHERQQCRPRNKQRKRKRKRKRRSQRQSAWKRSSFKSRNADKNPRYNPYTIRDVSGASLVKDDICKDLTVSVQRPKRASTSETRTEPKKVPRRTTSSSNSSNNSSSDNKREKSDAKVQKNLFDKTFKTVTMTMGSLTCCIRRATSLDKEHAEQVSKHLDKAVHTSSRARIMVFKALENYIYLKVARDPVGENSSVSTALDPLDLILDPTHGTTIVRNLIALVMNGGRDGGGGTTPKAPQAVAAKEIAKNIYQELCLVLPGLGAVNPEDIPLGVPRMEMAVNIHSAILTHFRRLPGLIISKMKKIGRSPETVPTLGADDDDPDDEEDSKFAAGHISTWWQHIMSLPPEVRPAFTPTAGFGDTFMLFSESALIPILWGGSEKKINSHPTRSILEAKVCTRKEAEDLAKSNYGELLRRLFVGDRTTIRNDPSKRQTSYGRQATTMRYLATKAPNAFGQDALQAYRNSLSAFYKARNEAIARGTLCTVSLPTLPRGDVEGKYVLSNYLVTNGLQAYLLGLDITKPHRSQKTRVGIQELERRFPDRQSIISTFGSNYNDCAVIGVDPGEVISASFCGLDPRNPNQVTNLHIKRGALYSPTLAHRRAMEQLKRRRPTINAQANIAPAIWTQKRSAADVDESVSAGQPCMIELPSIHELEGSLPSSAFETMDTYQMGLKQSFYVLDALTGFYHSKAVKKMNWERRKSLRSEMDWAVHGALQVIRTSSSSDAGAQRPSLIVYGNGRFNTRTKMASLHESFKGYFYMKVSCAWLMAIVSILDCSDLTSLHRIDKIGYESRP